MKFKIKLPVLFLILAAAAAVFLVSKNFYSTATPSTQASPSAQLKPSPSPQIFHPPVSGRQIKVPILLYHYIGNNPDPKDSARNNLSVSPNEFDKQMEYLSQNGFSPITLDTTAAGLKGETSLPEKPVVITFDDGYVDLYYNAFKILQKYHFRAVAFIPTGLMGTKYYASWEQLQEMQSSGLLSFQSHGVSHISLTQLSAEKLEFELKESKKTLEQRFGVPVNFIAYPYGTSNPTVWRSTQNAGYIGALGTWGSNIQSEGTIYDMPRIKIPGGADIPTFASRL